MNLELAFQRLGRQGAIWLRGDWAEPSHAFRWGYAMIGQYGYPKLMTMSRQVEPAA